MNQPDYISCRKNLTALRQQLEDAFDRGDEAKTRELSRIIDGLQMQRWALACPPDVMKTNSAAALPSGVA